MSDKYATFKSILFSILIPTAPDWTPLVFFSVVTNDAPNGFPYASTPGSTD
ncbi:hypothetical protein [Ktedonobacter robiniae]|uniref:Uncharacterized protein n=1 Tax=Ktedonobacter robiniae TaxID=2778365 RepID=A0ABQ3V298_9CHLR|nr:hypothetical protein [Ktedonobacter robiniae]GHO59291.1 hypothetical protein KSB_77660 [Ktedonobacter robiniae]